MLDGSQALLISDIIIKYVRNLSELFVHSFADRYQNLHILNINEKLMINSDDFQDAFALRITWDETYVLERWFVTCNI